MAVFSSTVRTRLDSYLTTLAADVATKQATYFAGQETIRPAYRDRDGNNIPAVTRTRNRYWQGLRSHAATPKDGATAAPDRLASKPTDQAESWTDAGIDPGATPEIALTCDVYQGPGGDHGFVLCGDVEYAGRLMRRCRNFQGSLTDRTTGWLDATAIAP